jgi:hypothetical protein
MYSFIQYITEASSVDEDMLGHLTHTKDIPHEEAKHADKAVDLIHQFHKLRQGQPSTVTASLKHDGGSSVHVMHDDKGVGVSDKHRMARGVVARTPEEVDKHFGHQPAYAGAMKHLLTHGKEFVNKGHHVQGDLLWTPSDKPKSSGGTTEYTPNRITYKGKTKAPLGIAVHTEITNGVAHGLTKKALKPSEKVFVPHEEYKPEPASYSHEDKKATETHLNAAKALMKGHSTEHLSAEHVPHFTTYLNRTTRKGTAPSVEGYKQHLESEGKKASGKLKTEAGQSKTMGKFKSLMSHVDKNVPHFQRSLDIRHHLAQATEHVLKGVEHPDLTTSIDGKKSQGEGVVLRQKDSAGKQRPISKLVPQKVSNAILNNPRFPRKGE